MRLDRLLSRLQLGERLLGHDGIGQTILFLLLELFS